MIKLPKKVKCPECDGKGSVDVGGYKDINRCPFCERGYLYWFDDLAAAVREAGYGYNIEHIFNKLEVVLYKAREYTAQPISKATGPTPTAALLAAINKFNAEVRDE